jgi:anti-sigma regulatory factor (Ser/Thr protein kinase)
MKQTVRLETKGWLQISTAGFAALNQSRPQEHLVKELVQNALDAVEENSGTVDVAYHHDGHDFVVECHDTGAGIADLSALRVVYLTFKLDSHRKRGRFGRGFKEILSVARSAKIQSGNSEIHFLEEQGRQITREGLARSPVAGTSIKMTFDWPVSVIAEFDAYFSRFLVPDSVTLLLNGRALPHRHVVHGVEATLTTEVYNPESQTWRKPRRKATIQLVAALADETPFIYEMGIPVAAAEWTVPFHVNVLQRVPMNPNRDALASGYAKQIHKACLPTLLPALDPQEATADWVGAAGAQSGASIQKQIITKAFGATAVRSVPSMGKRDFDHDAERMGASVVKTAQMSSGFREMAKEHLPTAQEAVIDAQVKAQERVVESGFGLSDVREKADKRNTWIERQGGRSRVRRCLSFAVWFCQQLVDSSGDKTDRVRGKLALGSEPELFGTEISTFMAHWSDCNVLTLALEVDCFWRDPVGAEALTIYVHEAAHARAMHHGKGFVDEVERLAGIAAHVMFESHYEINRRWPEFGVEASRDRTLPMGLLAATKARWPWRL